MFKEAFRPDMDANPAELGGDSTKLEAHSAERDAARVNLAKELKALRETSSSLPKEARQESVKKMKEITARLSELDGMDEQAAKGPELGGSTRMLESNPAERDAARVNLADELKALRLETSSLPKEARAQNIQIMGEISARLSELNKMDSAEWEAREHDSRRQETEWYIKESDQRIKLEKEEIAAAKAKAEGVAGAVTAEESEDLREAA